MTKNSLLGVLLVLALLAALSCATTTAKPTPTPINPVGPLVSGEHDGKTKEMLSCKGEVSMNWLKDFSEARTRPRDVKQLAKAAAGFCNYVVAMTYCEADENDLWEFKINFIGIARSRNYSLVDIELEGKQIVCKPKEVQP